jgi:hypothetical protein
MNALKRAGWCLEPTFLVNVDRMPFVTLDTADICERVQRFSRALNDRRMPKKAPALYWFPFGPNKWMMGYRLLFVTTIWSAANPKIEKEMFPT